MQQRQQELHGLLKILAHLAQYQNLSFNMKS